MFEYNQPGGPDQSDYYARRGVTSEVEQRMRADFAVAAQAREESLNVLSYMECSELMGRANTLQRYWHLHESAQVREDWDYLHDAYLDWQRRPGTMERMREHVIDDRLDGFTEAMTEKQWRSQQHAREMTGHGQWRESRDPFGTEASRSRAGSGLAEASPYRYAESANGWAEQVMRADFAHAHHLDQQRGQTFTDSDYLRVTEQMYEINESWANRDDELGREWRFMRDLASSQDWHEFADEVEMAEQTRGDEALPLNSPFGRSVDQIKELKGISREEMDAAREPIPGHAFTGLIGGREREEMER